MGTLEDFQKYLTKPVFTHYAFASKTSKTHHKIYGANSIFSIGLEAAFSMVLFISAVGLRR